MFKNYLKVALRNLKNKPAYSLINVGSLAIGLTCCILVLLYVQDELAFDGFHQHADRIYRITEARPSPDRGERYFSNTMGPVGPALVADFPEITNSVRMRSRSGFGRMAVRRGENRFYEGNHLIVEQSFFDVFDFKLLQGDRATVLREPLSVVLTESTAHKYFGEENPLGQTLNTDRFDLKVTGVIENPPLNSHLDFSMLISFATLEAHPGWQKFINSWESDNFITYVLADRTFDLESFNSKLPAFLEKKYDGKPEAMPKLSLQPMKEIHFGSAHLEDDLNRGKSEMTYVYAFSLIVLFVLLIACINYMNLATARAMKRAKEVGMRKVVGAFQSQLIWQFLGEAIILSVLALFMALVLVEIALPFFNTLSGKQLAVNLTSNGLLIAALFLLVCLVGIISGSYPAFFLSRLRPAVVLKGELRSVATVARLRQGLVVTQFALCIIMIIATTVAHDQINFVRAKNLGFNQEQLVVIDINSGNTRRNFQTIKNEIAKLPAVKSVSVSSRVPGEWKNIDQILAVKEDGSESEAHTMFFMCIDQDFFRTFEMSLIAGRNLSDEMGTDTSAVIINEAAAQALGWGDPLEKEIRVLESPYRARVVGVVKDFHFQSLHEKIAPLVLGHWNNPVTSIDYFTARVQAAELPATLASMQKIHEQFDQVTPFEYNFLDDRLNDFYQTDLRVGKIFGISAGLTILIACLGLFGLASFTIEQRTKEVGIRKVLGASVGGIVGLMSKDFAKLVLLANVVAWPVAYWAMNKWLGDFAYRINLGVGIFAFAGGLALLIALLTVIMHAMKAALANPVEALRYE